MSIANLDTSSGNNNQSLGNSGSTTIDASGLNAGTGTITLSGGTFAASDGSSFDDNSDLVVNGAFDLHGFSETLDALSGGGIVDNTVAGAVTLTVGNNSGSGTFNGLLQNTGGALSLTVSGGSLSLTNANTYSGTTNVNAGVLDISNATALGATTSGTTIAAGATLNVSSSLTLAEPLSLAGELSVGDGTNSGLTVFESAAITLTGTSGTFNTVALLDLLTVNVGLNGTRLTKSGSGTLSLTADNSDTGPTTISAGTLSVSGSLSDVTDVNVSGGATYNVATSDTIDGLSGAGNVTLNANTLTVGGNNDATPTFSGQLSGSGGLTKIGTGKQTLSGANSFTGVTTISTGTLSVSGSLSDVTDVSVATGATYDVAANDAIDGLSGAGRVTLNANTLTIGANNEVSATFSGSIRDAGGLRKIGTGKQTLTGTNTYTGTTTIDSGTLSVGVATLYHGVLTVSGSITSSVVVNVSGTLAGAGTITGSISGAGTVGPGNSAGTLTVNGNFAQQSSSNLNIEVGGLTAGTQYDRLVVNGAVTLGGNLNVSLLSGFAPTSTNTFKIIDNDSTDPVSGTFNGLSEGATFNVGGTTFKISYVGGDGNDVVISLPTPDIVLNSVITDGNTTLTVNYQILNSAIAAPVGLRFLKSTDTLYNAGDSALSDVAIKNTSDLTVGSHTVTFTIGVTVGSQVQLPGAVQTKKDDDFDYYVLAVIDPTNAINEVDTDPFNEDNTVSVVGAYVTPKGIYYLGGDSADSVVLTYPATITDNVTMAVSGAVNATYNYAYGLTSQIRLRMHGGNDSISVTNPENALARPMAEFGGDGDDSLQVAKGKDTLNGGSGIDTLVASGNVNFKLTNTSLSGLGSDSLTSFEIANLTGGADSNSFDISGWTGIGSISGGPGTSTSILGNTDAVVVNKNVNFTLTNSSLQTSDGMSFSLSGISKATLTGGVGDNSFNLTSWSGSGKLTGGSGNDTLSVTRDADFTLAPTTLTSPGYGTMSLATIEVANLTGGSGNNVFTLNNWLGSGTLTGAGGSDTLVAKYTAANVNLTLSDSQVLSSNGLNVALSGIGIANLIGGTSTNSFDVSGWHGTGSLNGGGGKGIDTVIVSADADFTLAGDQLTLTNGLSISLLAIKRASLTGLLATHRFVVTGWTPAGTSNNDAGVLVNVSR